MTPAQALAAGYADARPVSQEAADRVAAILAMHRPALAAVERQAA